MIDQYGRTIDYLRLSVTDLCNYRCQYCMPADGVEKGPHGAVLSVEEYGEIARAAVKLGIRKIRLTGGEPLVRRGILDLSLIHIWVHWSASDIARTRRRCTYGKGGQCHWR